MIIEVTMYTAKCDLCGHNCEFGDYSCYHDESTVQEDATAQGWHFTDDGKCYCNECHSIDDNNNLVMKSI